jgi:hypothetical protein
VGNQSNSQHTHCSNSYTHNTHTTTAAAAAGLTLDVLLLACTCLKPSLAERASPKGLPPKPSGSRSVCTGNTSAGTQQQDAKATHAEDVSRVGRQGAWQSGTGNTSAGQHNHSKDSKRMQEGMNRSGWPGQNRQARHTPAASTTPCMQRLLIVQRPLLYVGPNFQRAQLYRGQQNPTKRSWALTALLGEAVLGLVALIKDHYVVTITQPLTDLGQTGCWAYSSTQQQQQQHSGVPCTSKNTVMRQPLSNMPTADENCTESRATQCHALLPHSVHQPSRVGSMMTPTAGSCALQWLQWLTKLLFLCLLLLLLWLSPTPSAPSPESGPHPNPFPSLPHTQRLTKLFHLLPLLLRLWLPITLAQNLCRPPPKWPTKPWPEP